MDIAGNAELSNVLLAAILPFVFCYFNIVEVIKDQVNPWRLWQFSFKLMPFSSPLLQLSQAKFTEKELYTKVQMHVENRLNANAAFVHPYCLSLDSIANAMHSLIANNCLTKIVTVLNDKTVISYNVNSSELDHLSSHLHRYCSVLRHFNGLANYLIVSKM